MDRIECSQKAYEKLFNSGITRRIHGTETLIEILLNRNLNLLLKLLHPNEIPISDEAKSDIISLEREIESDSFFSWELDKSLARHPFSLGLIVLGKDLQTSQDNGFVSERELAESVTAYCIGENIRGKSEGVQIWRNKDKKTKNKFELHDHGDTSFSQVDISGKGPILYNPISSGIGFYQNCSPFLLLTLKYLKYLSMEKCEEIRSWREILNKSFNPWGGRNLVERWDSCIKRGEREDIAFGYNMEYNSVLVQDCFQNVTINNSQRNPTYFTNGKQLYFPIINGDQNLEIFRGNLDSEGEIDFGQRKIKNPELVLTYSPNDAKKMLLGVYKVFARDRLVLCDIMNKFVNDSTPKQP